MSRALLLPFREESSENPSVGVAADDDTDLEGATPRLGCGMFASSSEEMTYIVQDRVLRGSDIYHMAMNPQVCFGRQAPDELDTANNAKWRIGLLQDGSLD